MINTKISVEPEGSIKYFIVQSRASRLLLALFLLKFFVVLSSKEKILLRLILILKIGAIPFHFWFLRVRKSLTWDFLTLLMTWQKVAPIYLIIFSNKLLLITRAVFSILFGTLLQYKNSNLRLIIAYSSISNTCWIIVGILLNVLIMVFFVSIYFLSVGFMNTIFKGKTILKRSNFKNIRGLYIGFFFVLLLRGIPPTIAFIPKWLLIKEFVSNRLSLFSVFALTFTAINFYIYLRFFMRVLMRSENKTFLRLKIDKKLKLTSRLLIFFGILFMSV